MNLKKINRNLWIIALFLLLSVLYTFLFLHHASEIIATGDLKFHLTRIKGLETILTNPINLSVFNHSGQGVNLFYPFLTVLPAALFFHITHNLIVSYILYILLINVLTIFISYYCGKKFFKSTFNAFVFAIAYTFSAYRATNFFYRAALAEGVALTFLPLVFLGTYYVLSRQSKNWWLLAASLSLIIYTHILSALICLLFILLAFVTKLVIDHTSYKTTILNFSKSAILTIFLTSGFWLPLLEQLKLQSINQPQIDILDQGALPLSTIMIESLNNNLAYYSCGLIGIISLFIPIIMRKKSLTTIIKICWVFSIIALLITTNLFPWRLLQNTPLTIIQFPWRFMGIQSLFSSIVLTASIDKPTQIKEQISFICVGLAALLILTAASASNLHQHLRNDATSVTINTTNLDYFTSRHTSYYSADYIPKKVLPVQNKVAAHMIAINNRWQKRPHNFDAVKYTTKIHGNRNKIILPLYRYKGAQVIINGQSVKLTHNKYGLISFNTISKENNILVTYKYTPLSLIAYLVSALTLFGLIIYINLINRALISKKC